MTRLITVRIGDDMRRAARRTLEVVGRLAQGYEAVELFLFILALLGFLAMGVFWILVKVVVK